MSRLLKTTQVPGRRPLRRREAPGGCVKDAARGVRRGRGRGHGGEGRAGRPGTAGGGQTRVRAPSPLCAARRGGARGWSCRLGAVSWAASLPRAGYALRRPTHPGKKGAPAAARRPAEGAPRPARAGHGPQGPFPQRTARGSRPEPRGRPRCAPASAALAGQHRAGGRLGPRAARCWEMTQAEHGRGAAFAQAARASRLRDHGRRGRKGTHSEGRTS